MVRAIRFTSKTNQWTGHKHDWQSKQQGNLLVYVCLTPNCLAEMAYDTVNNVKRNGVSP